MENIKEVFADKEFDEITLKYIENFIEEFDDLFGKYLKREDVIKRIKENLNYSFEFADLRQSKIDGSYNRNTKKIKLANDIGSEEVLKTVVFHELTHCITAWEKYTGFSRKYTIEDLEQKDGFSEEITTCKGLTEGFTQLATRERDKKYFPVTKGCPYPVLTKLAENLTELIGVDNFWNIAFNEPEKIGSLLLEYGIVEDEFLIDDFFENFDIIYQNEKEIYELSENHFLLFLESQGLKSNRKYNFARAEIINAFTRGFANKGIATIKEFVELCNKNNEYASQLGADYSHKSYNVTFEKLKQLISQGVTPEEILANLDDELRRIIYPEIVVQEFLESDAETKLRMMTDSEKDLYVITSESNFEKFYHSMMVANLFGRETKNKDIIFKDLSYGLAAEILEKGYDPNKISLECIKFEDFGYGLAYNLYESDGVEMKYLGTFASLNAESDFLRMKVISSEEEKKKILEDHKDIPHDATIFTDDYGGVLAYLGENEYIYIDDENEEHSNYGKVTYNQNRIEVLYGDLQRNVSRYKEYNDKAQNNGTFIVKKDIEKIEKEILKAKGITPEEIEEIVENTTLADLEKILDELSNDYKRRKTFEGEIGYDG